MRSGAVDLALEYLESDDVLDSAYESGEFDNLEADGYEDEDFGDESEMGDEGIRDRLRRLSVISRIVSLLHGLPMPADVPPNYQPPPPIVAPAEKRKANAGPRQRPPREAAEMLDHFGHLAADAESNEEADEALGALLPLARALAGRLGSLAMRRAAPAMNAAFRDAGHMLRGSARTRPLVRALPAVARRAAVSVRRATAQGAPPTANTARDALLRAFASVLGNPKVAYRAAGNARTRPCTHCGKAGRAPQHAARPCGCRHHGS